MSGDVGICFVCKEERAVWCGYTEDKNGMIMHFCEKCKMRWVRFAENRGAKFAPHERVFGVTDGRSACINNLSREQVIELWKDFVDKNITPEKVLFT